MNDPTRDLSVMQQLLMLWLNPDGDDNNNNTRVRRGGDRPTSRQKECDIGKCLVIVLL